MNQKDTLHYLRIIEIGKSKELPDNVIEEMVDRDLIELDFIDKQPVFNGNHILTEEGFRLIQNSR